MNEDLNVSPSKTNDYELFEINTGKTWINGKPIYRKVCQANTQVNARQNTWTTVDLNFDESIVDQFLECRIVDTQSDNINMCYFGIKKSPFAIMTYRDGYIISPNRHLVILEYTEV